MIASKVPIPSLCLIRLKALSVKPCDDVLSKLAQHCQRQNYEFLSVPVDFSDDWMVGVADRDCGALLQKQMLTWALSGEESLGWLESSMPVVSAGAARFVAPIEWRPAQNEMRSKLSVMREDALAVLEGGTGIGKTRVACQWAADLIRTGRGPVLVAVPTIILVKQWISEFATVAPDLMIQPVLGAENYSNSKVQALALASAASAQLVICTQHMLVKVQSLQRWNMVIDEVHLLDVAIAATAGKSFPIHAMGLKFEAWCRDNLGVHEGVVQEVSLRGSARKSVIDRLGLKGEEARTSNVLVSVQSEGAIYVAIRPRGGVEQALKTLWDSCASALLLSATQSVRSGAGVRSVRLLVERLGMPQDRLQDLGCVRASWRDKGVVVVKPQSTKVEGGHYWLSPHADRKDKWFMEMAAVIKRWSVEPSMKTIMLATSYADIDGINAACAALGVQGVLASNRKTSMAELQQVFSTNQVWCWIATGSAWTGMDLKVPVRRVAISKLPLQYQEDGKLVRHAEQLSFDCVNRFAQGLGRMVRGDDGVAYERELVIMDGRINETMPWWRGLCQPYMQLLGEAYEEHRRLLLE